MVHVGRAYRYDDVPHAQVESGRETFLNPELFEGDFAATFDFRLVFAGFLLFDFNGAFGSAMFKLDFATHTPAPAEVISEEDDDMRQVEPPVAFAFMQMSVLIFLVVVAEKVARGYRFAISPYGEAGFAGTGRLSLGRRFPAEFFQNFGFQFGFQLFSL